MTHLKVAARRPHARNIRRNVRLSAATAMALLVAASPSLAQSIEAEGAVNPAPPAGGSWTALDIRIGDGAAGSVTASGSAAIEARSTTVGYGAEGSGTLVLTGDGTTLDNSLGLHVGHIGDGELRILDGARASAGLIELGSQDGSFGRLIVSGEGSRLEAAPDAASRADVWIGRSYGSGEMTVELGGVVRTGLSYVDTGSVTVDGSGSLWETHFLDLMDDDSSLTVTNGGRVQATSFLVGDSGSASARVDGAASRLDVDTDILVGAETGSDGLLTLSGGAALVAGGFVSIGEGGSGILVVESGATLTSDSGYLGFERQSNGTAMINGEGSRWDSTLFVLGTYDDTQGTLVVSNGGVASAGEDGEFQLGYTENASGTIVIGAASGEEALGAGLIEGARLVFGEGSGHLVFNHTGLPDGEDLRFAPDLTGAGTILHENGVTYLDGDGSAFSGMTSVTGGRLMVMNGLGGSVGVGGGGFLGGTSTIGSGTGSMVTIGAGGTLGPGDPVGTLTIDGDLVFETGSAFEVGLRTGQPSDALAVTGTVDAAGGRVSVVTLDEETSYADGGTYRILDTQGGFVSEFGGVDSQSAFLQFILDHSEFGLDLIVQTPDGPIDFSEVARTRNQRATALALNGLAQSSPSLALYNALAMLGEGGARDAFDQLSGEIHASFLTGLIEDSLHVRNAANNRIRAAFAGVGASSAQVLAYGPGGPAAASATFDGGMAAWGTAFGSWGSTEGDGNAAALDRATGGLLFGADAMVSGNWRLGLLAGYSRSSFDVDGRASSATSDNYHLGLYGGAEWDGVSVRSGLAYSWHDVGGRRSVGFNGFADALSADYHAHTVQAFGELATTLDVGGKRFEPFANLAYVAVDAGGFAESGGAAGLSSAGSSTETTFATLGVRAEHAIATGAANAKLTGMLAWQHAFGDTVPTATQAFASSDVFAVAGAPIARNSAIVEAGLELAISAQATFDLSYQGRLSRGAQDHGFGAGVNMRF